MISLKSSLIIALLTCAAACGRQVVDFPLGDDGGQADGNIDGPIVDAPAPDALSDAPLDAPLGIRPTVTSNVPGDRATAVALTTAITATFSEPMNPATLTTLTFSVRQGATPVNGTVMLDVAGTTARFTPTLPLLASRPYTAMITTGAQATGGLTLAADHVWTFRTASNALPPTVTSTTPLAGAMNVSTNVSPTATFSRAMDPASIDPLTFTLVQGATLIGGTVTLDSLTNTATFDPTSPLVAGLVYTASIATGAMDTASVSLTTSVSWSFTTGACAQAPITLGVAGTFAVLAGSTVTSTGLSTVTGDLGVSPLTAVTGFPPGILVGTQHTDATSATAIADLTTAYNEAAGRGPVECVTAVAGNLGGMTLVPGLYKSTSSLIINSGNLTLDAQGDPDAVWVITMATTLETTSGLGVILAGGARSENIYWQVGTSATLGAGSMFHGTIMADQAITLNTGATLLGRALARIAAVTLDSNIVTLP